MIKDFKPAIWFFGVFFLVALLLCAYETAYEAKNPPIYYIGIA